MTNRVTVIALTTSGSSLSDTVDKIEKSCKKYGVDFYPILTQHAYIDDRTATAEEITIQNYDGTGKSITLNPSDTVCFARGGVTNTQIGLAILTIFENTGMFVINERAAMELCANKLSTAIKLEQHSIPTPRTAFVANLSSLDASLKKIGNKYPVIVKTLTGAEGVGVSVINTYESLKSVLQTLWKYKAEVIIQEYLQINNDVRTLVLDGRVVAAAQRGKAPKDFRTNLARGAKGGPYTLNDDEIAIVEKAARVFDCYYVGVDSVLVDGKPYIIEMNASPGSGNVYRSYFDQDEGSDITGQKLIDRVVKHAIDRDNWHFNQREAGALEKIDIDGVGSLTAKLDTGNDSYNVLHADSIKEISKNRVSFRSGGKNFVLPVQSHTRIRTSSLSDPERRPVVLFDVKFRNRIFRNVKFSLTQRHNNRYPVLIGKKFLSNARVSVNVNKSFDLPEEFVEVSQLDQAITEMFKKMYAPNPTKFTDFRSQVNQLALTQEHLEDQLKNESSPEKQQVIKTKLFETIRQKEESKQQMYDHCNKEAIMPVDKDFEVFLASHLKEESLSTRSRQLIGWLQELPSLAEASSTKKFTKDKEVKQQFKKKYGKRWKNMMYSTACKMHKEAFEVAPLEEANKRKSKGQMTFGFAKKDDAKKGDKKDGKKTSKKSSKKAGKKGSGEGGDSGGSYAKFLKISGGNSKRARAAVRFLGYDKGNPRHKGSPKQTGYNPSVKDGDVKGRFRAKRYYGGQSPTGGKNAKWNQIRYAVAVKIAKGTQNLSGLAKGRGKKK